MKYDISVIITIFNRHSEAIECIDSIIESQFPTKLNIEFVIIDNNSTERSSENVLKSKIATTPNAQYHERKINDGVACGRNFGIQISSGNFLFFIDDDAILPTKDAFLTAIKRFSNQPTLGAIAIPSYNFYTRSFNRKETPSQHRIGSYGFTKTHHFVGVSHFIRSAAIKETGFYPNDFFYGMEEYDLSYKLYSKGYIIEIANELKVLHKKCTKGRIESSQKLKALAINKIRVAARNLPIPLVLTHMLLWNLKVNFSIETSAKDRCELIIDTINELYKAFAKPRIPLSYKIIKDLKAIGAPIFY